MFDMKINSVFFVAMIGALCSGSFTLAAAQDLNSENALAGSENIASYQSEPSIDEIVASHQKNDRIVGGDEATPGKWLSTVAVYLKKPGREPFNFCGGTVIGKKWVLTAGHCTAAMKKMQLESNGKASFFIREGTQNLVSGKGQDIPVAAFLTHEDYRPSKTLNDLGLLKLQNESKSPIQKLLSSKLLEKDLSPGRVSTVVGFGLMNEQAETTSVKLRQVDLPIVSQSDCKSVYGADAITKANFCAGYKEGGKDSCQGDSGGPLFIRAENTGEAVQAGVVSWGNGCARPEFYGVYASVGNFDSWLKNKVRDVVFVDNTATESPTSAATASLTEGAAEASKPSKLAQVTIDIEEGRQLKVGTFIQVKVVSSVDGAVVIFSQSSDGTSKQIYPSKIFPSSGPDPKVANIKAGQEVLIPSATQSVDGFRFVIRPPEGRSKLIAMVVPNNPKLVSLITKYADSDSISDLPAHISEIANTELESRGVDPVKIDPVDRATAEVEYEISK